MPRLYHFVLSPFSRKIRLVLAEKKIEVELIEERYWEERTDFMRMNPAGKVPVLQIDGLTLADSSVISEYLEEKYPTPALLPTTPANRAEARRMTAWFDDKFHHDVTKKLLYEKLHKRLMKSGYPDGKAIKEGSDALKFHLGYLHWLLETRKWVAGDHLTIADFAAAAQLSCLDYIDVIDWELSSDVKDWYSKVKSRPAFRTLLIDMVPGFPPSQKYADLDF